MPVYEYRCSDCDTTFEKLIRTSGQKPGACPSCGRENATRVFSTFAVGSLDSLRSLGRSGEPRCANPQPGCGRCN